MLDYYWELTPNQFKKHIEVFQKLKKSDTMEKDAINFNLGKYIALAFHDPKKYPKKPFLYEEKKTTQPMTDEEMKRIMNVNTTILAGKIKSWQKQ